MSGLINYLSWGLSASVELTLSQQSKGLRQEEFRADSTNRYGRTAVMTMGISEHALIMITWFAKNFGRYDCQF
jgi:hypothetical protein